MGAHRRGRKVAAALAASTVVAVAAPLLPANGKAAGYRFHGLVVDRANPHSVVVRYGYGWEGSEFPGWVTCLWTVEDADGRVIAEKSVQLVGLRRSYTSKEIDVPRSAGIERGKPERATVSCDGTRLDDPNGAYTFANVKAELAPAFQGDRRTVALSFDVDWSGAGLPGVGDCVARVRDAGGAALFDHPFTLTSEDGSSLSMRAIAPTDLPSDPASAAIECRPYAG